jgi:hypothetical protein
MVEFLSATQNVAGSSPVIRFILKTNIQWRGGGVVYRVRLESECP